MEPVMSLINAVNRSLEKEIESRTGQKARTCFQCKKCSAGCPVAFAMNILPHEVMKMVTYGQERRLLSSSTIWLCAACETCTTRCPNDIDIAGIMDGLRHIAVEKGAMSPESNVVAMHRSFLSGIALTGKTNESILIGGYKARTRDIFGDIGLGLVMLFKGKVKPLPRVVKDRRAVRRIFRSTGNGGKP